jgi:hypothetical protein
MVADLHTIADAHAVNVDLMATAAFYRAVADRLAELDAKPCAYVRADDEGTAYCTLTPMMAEEWHGLLAEHQRIDALRPPCPTCGGKGEVWNDPATDPLHRHFHVPCPENSGNCDGKVPIERLVKVFEAVHLLVVYPAAPPDDPANKIIRNLQAIR